MRQDGRRGALVSVLKAGNASTIDVVKGIRGLLPRVAQTLPPETEDFASGRSVHFVRGSVNGVIREAVIGFAPDSSESVEPSQTGSVDCWLGVDSAT